VKTGKKGALGGVSKNKAAIVILVALGLAGCASVDSKSAASSAPPTRIVLVPSDDAYRSAMQSLSAVEQKTLKKGLGFTVDTLLAAPTPIESMQWSRKRPDTPTVVDISEFVRFLDLQPAISGGARVNLATARVFAGINYETATLWPVFRIEVEVEPSNASVVSVSGFGSGPKISRSDGELPLASPQLTRSEDIAVMKAFLKTLLKINEQVQQG
jgi:hypothetical protein